MHIQVRTFWLPKAGNSNEDYEDAWCAEDVKRADSNLVRFAVADGATEASFSALWANLLVKAYSSGQVDAASLDNQLPNLQALWLKDVGQKVLPWYAEEKLRSGAFATLLGITFRHAESRSDRGSYVVTAIGDSCFFQIRAGKLSDSFPLCRSEQFSSHPMLLSSLPGNNQFLSETEVQDVGDWETGDVIYLMTDALACWFLAESESGIEDHDIFATIDSQEAFGKFISALRTMKTDRGEPKLKNDDVTLIRCKIQAPL